MIKKIFPKPNKKKKLLAVSCTYKLDLDKQSFISGSTLVIAGEIHSIALLRKQKPEQKQGDMDTERAKAESSSSAAEAASDSCLAKVRVGGAWAGIMEVDLQKCTLLQLRQELASRCRCTPDSLNIISAGKHLKSNSNSNSDSDNCTLVSLGLRPNSRILVTKASVEQAKVLNEELDAQQRLARITAAIEAMAKRHTDNSFPIDDFSIELENQSGNKMVVGSDIDQRAVIMGLMLHKKGQSLVKQGKYKDGLEILTMAEEAFSVCDSKLLESVDNTSILQIDIVWCYFMLRDISWLALAGRRLNEARKGLQRCYGANMERARVLQGGFCPELAIFTRLEVLEGVVAYHSGSYEEARKALVSAQEKYQKLQVSDEALTMIANMGFTADEARRALRMCGQDVQLAIEFVIEEKRKVEQKIIENIRHKKTIREQISYGKTPLGKAVDMTMLSNLILIGFEKCLAAEALRKNENDMQKALDELTDPRSNSALQTAIDSKKRKRKTLSEEEIAELLSMGFEIDKIKEAENKFHSKTQVIDFLLRNASNPASNTQTTDIGNASNPGSNTQTTDSSMAEDLPSEGSYSENTTSTSSLNNEHDIVSIKDEEIEGEITEGITGDPMADYDIEVVVEGQAIAEYLSLLASVNK